MLVSEAVEEVRRLVGGEPSARNKLVDYVDATKTLTFTYDLGGITAGSVIENQTTDELHYVWSADTGAKTAVVERGEAGTSSSTAPVANDLYRVSPRHRRVDIKRMLLQELDALQGAGLYSRKEAAVTFDWTNGAYDITAVTDMIAPYAVEVDYGGVIHTMHDFTRRDDFIRPWRLPPVSAATLLYRGEFTDFTANADNLESTCGLPESAHDVLCLGAAARLLMGKEALRLDVQAHPTARQPEEVPPSALSTQARRLLDLRNVRLAQELDRLRLVWPIKAVG